MMSDRPVPRETLPPHASVGTVISYGGTPDTFKFFFVASNRYDVMQHVRVGKHVTVRESDGPAEGLVIGQIVNLIKINEYFLNAQTMKDNRPAQLSLNSIFPVDQWEYVLAEVNVLGFFPVLVRDERAVAKTWTTVTVPVSPGSQVQDVDPTLLEQFMGLNGKDGFHLGDISIEGIPATFDPTRLLQKHLAILAMSGAGKSYLVSVLLEEFIKCRRPVPPVIVIDTHGEYAGLFKDASIEARFPHAKVTVINGSFIQVATPLLTMGSFLTYMPNMSHVQARELMRVFNDLKAGGAPFDLRGLIVAVNADDKIGQKTKDALSGWLYMLDRHGLFSTGEFPRVPDVLRPNHLIVLDLSGLTSNTQKQIIVDYITNRAFYLRRNNAVPPFCLVLEEAHQYVPQAAAPNAIARHSIETMAREGRKFFASLVLISQRPVHLNTTVLSQCNTQLILRISNPNDLDHVRAASEKMTADAMRLIASLPVGQALVVGGAVNVPLFFKVRAREFLSQARDPSLFDAMERFVDTGG